MTRFKRDRRSRSDLNPEGIQVSAEEQTCDDEFEGLSWNLGVYRAADLCLYTEVTLIQSHSIVSADDGSMSLACFCADALILRLQRVGEKHFLAKQSQLKVSLISFSGSWLERRHWSSQRTSFIHSYYQTLLLAQRLSGMCVLYQHSLKLKGTKHDRKRRWSHIYKWSWTNGIRERDI